VRKAISPLLITLLLPTVALADDITVSKEKRIGELTDDHAVVYFVRPGFLGKAVKIWAFVDDKAVGANKGKQYTFANVEPGKHVFWSKAENVAAVEMNVEGGKAYYIQQKPKMGGMKARVQLFVLEEAEGKAALEKCKGYTTLTAEGETRAAEIIANKFETATQKLEG
jgi:hypothetical protein